MQEVPHEGTRVPRAGSQGLGGGARRGAPGSDGRRRTGRHHHDLRHRPAHPARRRPRRDRRTHPGSRGGRDRHAGRCGRHELRRRRPRPGAGDHQVRSVRVLPAGHALALPDGGRDRLDLRAPHRRDPGGAGAGAVRGHLALRGAAVGDERAGDLPGRLAADGVRGGRPGGPGAAGRHRRGRRRRRGRPVGHPDGGPVGGVEGHRGRLEQVPPREGPGVRRYRRAGGGTGHDGRRPRADRRARCRRRHRGGRLPRDAPHGGLRRAARRDDRQHRRARDAGAAPHAGAVDPEHHHDHGTGRHRLDPDAAEDGRQRSHPGREDGDAHLHVRPDGRGVRGLRRGILTPA